MASSGRWTVTNAPGQPNSAAAEVVAPPLRYLGTGCGGSWAGVAASAEPPYPLLAIFAETELTNDLAALTSAAEVPLIVMVQ